MTLLMKDSGQKVAWQGVLLSVQPRIRLTRSFDQRSHTYLGYALKVRGTVGRYRFRIRASRRLNFTRSAI